MEEHIISAPLRENPTRDFRREIIAGVVGLVILVATIQLTYNAGFAAAAITIIATLITPMIIYPIASRWKVRLAILPHVLACILLLFRMNTERPMDMVMVWGAILIPGLAVAWIMYAMERLFGAKGIWITIALAAVGLVIYLLS